MPVRIYMALPVVDDCTFKDEKSIHSQVAASPSFTLIAGGEFELPTSGLQVQQACFP